MTRIFQGTCVLPIILACASFCLAKFDVTHEWKYIDYVWESDSQKQEAVDAGVYDHTKISTHDVQPLSDGRILVTTPKYFKNPASLSTISDQTGAGGPLLAPYPNWAWHTKKDCSGITSVDRVFLDECNRLWFVDSGKIGKEQVCPAKILAFDAATDELITKFEIPSDLSHNPNDSSRGKVELHLVEATGPTCENTWVYMADVEGHGLLIWDGSDIWRLDGDEFAPRTEVDTLTVENETFDIIGGITVLISVPTVVLEKPSILFRPLSGPRNFIATTEELHNSKYGDKIVWNTADLQAPWIEPAKAISPKTGALFSGFAGSSQYGCWNMRTPYEMVNVRIPDEDHTKLVWVSSAKITSDADGINETLTITSNRKQKFVLGTMDFTEVNFRVLNANVNSYIAGTVCEPAIEKIPRTLEHLLFYPYQAE